MKLNTWNIIKPYWVSQEKWIALGLLVLTVGLDMLTIFVSIKISFWQKNFFDALVDYNLRVIKPLMITLLCLIALTTVADIFGNYFKQDLQIRWRTWLTQTYIKKYLEKNAFYHIEQQLVDNPDQRISEDLALISEKTLNLMTGFIRNIVNLISYTVIILGISQAWSFYIGNVLVVIPGILLWLGILYAIFGSFVMEKTGRPLIKIEYQQQKYEANFRHLLISIREYAEQISLSKGQKLEEHRLLNTFLAIQTNWKGLMTYIKRISFVEKIYIEIGAYLPYFLILQQYFAKKISVGDVMQISIAFNRLRQALSWFIFNYKELAEIRAVIKRLHEFEIALNVSRYNEISFQLQEDQSIKTQNLVLELPNKEKLSQIPDIDIQQGERWLIKGRSGVGKSILLRAISGIWIHGTGKILLPREKNICFLPQKTYHPDGSLKSLLCYPFNELDVSDGRCIQVINLVNLAQYNQQLHTIAPWSKILSPGEQQRFAFARVFLQCPDILFLDEATSALDAQNEENLYQFLQERLPHTTIISVAHHPNLERFHSHVIEIK